MNIKNIAGIAVLVLTVGLAIQLVQQNNAQAKSPVQGTQIASQQNSQSQNVQAVEYARLVVDEDADSVTWLIGGNDRVRTESIRETYRRLGGSGRGTFSDLLNQVGAGGWNLVQKDGQVWIFSRRAQ